ncbi:MAG: type II secretion system protein [Fretibacterium sp.]|uniref:prepilin-type N-terminal cleavage/methylation domain-containing protein n=1 Tax=Fretibacterium sp. OH1220_COT-178 TaxID=2491047 RepID=UPI000F5F64BF|nr:prepilin-type N-terminal cleavage/methylation domain-containing protein [Fretibacterium sp. OH1220_COT-178]MDO4785836.1 type II secretion system protein [Fretibacterium sp.]RRD63692.1 prepilin-type N-terminal cleavage/methylation domain-containing protein [Fretibacterium sp. OH1220_COT-178]
MARRAFTLVEILIVVLLAGLVTTLALAPVVFAVRRVVETQAADADAGALERALAFIGRDVAAALRLAPFALKVEDHRALGGVEDDVLFVASTAPAKQNLPVGNLVYRIDRGGPLREDTPPGLYRWFLPGTDLEKIDAAKLRGETGQLVLPGVTAFGVEVVDRSERHKEYEGDLPVGLVVTLARGQGKDEERLEHVFVYP